MSNTLKFGNGEWYGKKDTILAYNDENSNFKPLPFSFDRASSATVINKDGLIETVGSGEPRIDYKDDSKGALLLEPQRSNLITNSNNLTTWNGAAMTRTLVDDLINPSNGLDASKLLQSASGGYAWLSRTFTGNETFSAFVKKDTSNFVRLYAGGNSVYFNILNGTIETISGSVEDKSIIDYGNGWFRISISVNSTAASYVRIYPASSGSSSSGTNSLFVFGAQLEQGSYATSYIPTQGGVVTRVAESCSQTPPSGIIGQTEGTMYFQTNKLFSSGTRSIALAYTSGSSYYQIYLTSSNQIRVDINGSLLVITSTINLNILNKIAFAYKSGENILYVNGVELASSGNATVPSSLNDFYLGNSLGNEQSGSYQEFKLYNTRLSNAELQALTT